MSDQRRHHIPDPVRHMWRDIEIGPYDKPAEHGFTVAVTAPITVGKLAALVQALRDNGCPDDLPIDIPHLYLPPGGRWEITVRRKDGKP